MQSEKTEVKTMQNKASLLMGIVNAGQASAFLKYVKTIGISGGTIVKGEGTVTSGILNMLGLTDRRKEVLLMVIPRELEKEAHEKISKKFELHKKDHGILFSMNIHGVIGAHGICCPVSARAEEKEAHPQGGHNMSYQQIVVIVERGSAEDVIDAAKTAGATGGTILHGRGSGVHETASIFNLTIEPEKELVFIVAQDDQVVGICESIDKAMQLDKPGNGILFTMDVNQVSGLYQGE